jgi:hypothetical protein
VKRGYGVKVQTAGGKMCGPSLAHLSTVGTDGRIYGSVANGFTHTWWHLDGRHNTFPDLNLPRETAAEFVRVNSTGSGETPDRLSRKDVS